MVTKVRTAIKATTGADVSQEDIRAILVDYAPDIIPGKIQLMGNMGRQEPRNVPGLLVYLLKDDLRHVPGRVQGKDRTAPKKRAGNRHADPEADERERKRVELLKSLYVN